VTAYEKNPALVQKANEAAAAGKAKGIMGMAENYAKIGRADLAKKKYQEVITRIRDEFCQGGAGCD